jgi:heme/copper-type cytochrome/quinol oxidase subunit 2
MFKYYVIFFLLFFISPLYSQRVGKIKIKTNQCEWRFKNCGRVMIDGTSYNVRAMNTIDFESQHEMTLYTDSNHVVTIQRTSQQYYFTVLYPDGKLTCKEFTRDTLIDWIFKIFILP